MSLIYYKETCKTIAAMLDQVGVPERVTVTVVDKRGSQDVESDTLVARLEHLIKTHKIKKVNENF